MENAKRTTVVKKFEFILFNIFCVFAWIYFILRVFIFDVDGVVTNMVAPEFLWLVDYKPVFLMIILAVWLIFVRKTAAVLCLVGLLIYPIIMPVALVFYLTYRTRSAVILIAALNFAISSFRSLKYTTITFAAYILAALIAGNATDKGWLIVSISILSILLVMSFYARVAAAFQSKNVLKIYKRCIKRFPKIVIDGLKLDEELKSLSVENMNSTQLDKWRGNLFNTILVNHACLYVAKYLRDYQRSGVSLIYTILVAIFLLILTTLSFALVNYAIFKIDAMNFSLNPIGRPASFFLFYYYSFNTFVFNSINEVAPVTSLTWSLSIAQKFSAILITGVFVSILASVQWQRHSVELDEVIREAEAEGKVIDDYIKSEYQVTSVEGAIAEINKIKEGTANILVFFSRKTKKTEIAEFISCENYSLGVGIVSF